MPLRAAVRVPVGTLPSPVSGMATSMSRAVGPFAAGEVITAQVRFKAPVGTTAQIGFLSSARSAPLTSASGPGTGTWQLLQCSLVVAAGGPLTLVLSGSSDGSTPPNLIFDEVLVSSAQRGLVFEDGFEDGTFYSAWTLGGSTLASLASAAPLGVGTLSDAGVYTAPASLPSEGMQVHVTARSKADPRQTDRALVTLRSPLAILPASAALPAGGQQAFQTVATGLSGPGATWKASAGSIDAQGVFTAPATPQTVTLTATSTADPSQTATALVAVGAPSLVPWAHFPFDEGTGTQTQDTTGNGTQGSLQPGTTWVAGYQGSGLSLYGSGGVSLRPAIKLGGAWTVSSWVLTPLPATGNYHMLAQGERDAQILVHYDGVSLGCWDGLSNSFKDSGFRLSSLAAGWHHVVAVGEGGSTRFYVDGQAAGTPVPVQSSASIAMLGNTLGGNQPLGTLDEVSVYPRALGPSEVQAVYAQIPRVVLTPSSALVLAGTSMRFSGGVANAPDRGVTWALPDRGSGSVAADGTYTAPATLDVEGAVHPLVAYRAQDPSYSATAFITLRSPVAISPAKAVVALGGSQAFAATVTGQSNPNVTWWASGGSIDAAGRFTAPTAAGTYQVVATSVGDPTKKATATVTVLGQLAMSPASVTVPPGLSQAFQATVSGFADPGVTWRLQEPGGGSIDRSGVYTAPLRNAGVFHVSAVSVADPTQVGTAVVTVRVQVKASPSKVSLASGGTQALSATVLGTADTSVTWSVLEGAAGGSVDGNGVYTAPATAAGVFHVQVTSKADPTASDMVVVQVATPPVLLTLNPSSVEMGKGGSAAFTATVTGSSNTAVTWSASGGSIDGVGNFTAPAAFGTYTVRATSQADSTAYAESTVTVKAQAGSDKAFSYDENGNLVSDGDRSFEWDAEDRLVAVNLASGHRTEFGYDGFGRRVVIREWDPDAAKVLQKTSEKKYLWIGAQIAQERDASGATVLRRFFEQGFVDGDGTALYYTRDHLGSVRELTDGSQTVRARYDYDPYGRMTKISGDRDSLFGYTGHLWHPQSGLNLTLFRAYDPNLGRWISRDPIGERGGVNLYDYVSNNPVQYVDPYGLAGIIPDPNGVVPGGPWTPNNAGRPGNYFGPKPPKGGRPEAQWVPPEADGGPPGSEGYWKTKKPGGKWDQRYDQEGNPITPDEAHPGPKSCDNKDPKKEPEKDPNKPSERNWSIPELPDWVPPVVFGIGIGIGIGIVLANPELWPLIPTIGLNLSRAR